MAKTVQGEKGSILEELRDPVHGLVYLSKHEKKAIDTAVMQRLRCIRQLAFTHLAYPGALHTRFDHSIGTCHLAGRMADQVLMRGQKRKAVRFAALFHDVGHAPFSHVGEAVMRRYSKATGSIHEKVSSTIIREDDQINRLLDGDNGPGVDAVASIVEQRNLGFVGTWIVSGPVDADKLDYLIRDSYFTGVKYGIYDLDKVINEMVKVKTKAEHRLAFREGGIYAIEQLVLAKFHMTTQVYCHKVRAKSDAIAFRGICLAIDDGVIKERLFCYEKVEPHLREFLALNDDSLSRLILDGENEYARRMFIFLRDRTLLPTVYAAGVDKERFPDDSQLMSVSGLQDDVIMRRDISKIERDFAEEMDLDPNMVILDIQSVKSPSFSPPEGQIAAEDILILTDDGNRKKFHTVSQIIKGSAGTNEQSKVKLLLYAPLKVKEDKKVQEKSNVVMDSILDGFK